MIEELNHEVQKLQKELSEFSMLSDYESISTDQYFKQKFTSPKYTSTKSSLYTTCSPSSEKRLEAEENSNESSNEQVDLLNGNTSNQLSNEMKRVFLYSQISPNITLENIKNLPDLTLNLSTSVDESIYVNSSEDDFKSLSSSQEILSPDNTSLNEQHLLISEVETEEHQTLLLELQKCKENEIKWEQEKQKILIYQRQLQQSILEVLGKTERLEEKFKSQAQGQNLHKS